MLKSQKRIIRKRIGLIATSLAIVGLAGGGVAWLIISGQNYVAVGEEIADSDSKRNNDEVSKILQQIEEENKRHESGDSENGEAGDGENGDDNEKKDEATRRRDEEQRKSTERKTHEETDEATGDKIVTTEVFEDQDIGFGVERQNEQNMPRGEVRVKQAGSFGTRRITYKLTYRNDRLESKEEIRSEVTREPVNQIDLVGTSDYNINTSYIQLYPNAKVLREGREGPAMMILVNGNYYIDFWHDPVSWKSYAPSVALQVGGGTFSYEGKSYKYELGPLDSSFRLNMEFCNEYKLACGSW